MMDLTNKVAIVTGAAGGLGKALATELFLNGCHLALLDTNMAGLEKLKTELQGDQRVISLHNVDISSEEQIIAARQEILQQHRRIDLLINNAGISVSQPFEQMELTDYKSLFNTNFWGTVYCTRHFLDDLKKQPESRLVNIISDFALMGFPGKTAYASSKSAIMGFACSLMTELAGSSVRVSLVIPPPMPTALVSSGKHRSELKKKKENDFLKKHGMLPEMAARRIIPKIRAGKFRIVVGAMMFWIDLVSRLFPSFVHCRINRKKYFDFI